MMYLVLNTICLLISVRAIDQLTKTNDTTNATSEVHPSLPVEETCSNVTKIKVNPQDVYFSTTTSMPGGNVEKINVLDHTRLNASLNFTNTSWRLICPQQHYIAVVILELNVSSSHALNIKHIQLTGCTDIPQSYIFTKKSIMLGVNGTMVEESTFYDFDIGVICIRHNSKLFAEQILFPETVMLYIKNHISSYEKVASLLSHPETLIAASNDPQIQTILDLSRGNDELLLPSGSGA